MPWQIWQAEQVGDTDCLLSFLALSHKKNPRIFACKNRKILTQKRESEHVRIQYLREPVRFATGAHVKCYLKRFVLYEKWIYNFSMYFTEVCYVY